MQDELSPWFWNMDISHRITSHFLTSRWGDSPMLRNCSLLSILNHLQVPRKHRLKASNILYILWRRTCAGANVMYCSIVLRLSVSNPHSLRSLFCTCAKGHCQRIKPTWLTVWTLLTCNCNWQKMPYRKLKPITMAKFYWKFKNEWICACYLIPFLCRRDVLGSTHWGTDTIHLCVHSDKASAVLLKTPTLSG